MKLVTYARGVLGALAGRATQAPTPGPLFPGGLTGSPFLGNFARLMMPGATFDYQAQAGTLWHNSAIAIALGWVARNYTEPDLGVRRKMAGELDAWAWDERHPALKLFDRPNDYHTLGELMAAVRLSLVVDGNGYLIRGRDRAGRLAALWYASHEEVEPLGDPEGVVMITGYRVTVQGRQCELLPRDVVHFRTGIDPTNPRKGMSAVKAQLREVCSDNEAAGYTAATLRNLGIIGLAISMEDGSIISPEDAQALTTSIVAKTTGEARGKPLVTTHPLKIQTFGLSPEDMLLDRIRIIPEARILAAIGLSAQVLGLTSGEASKTYANYAEARTAAYQDFLVPCWKADASQLQRALVVDFPDLLDRRVIRLAHNTEDIDALADDRAATSTRILAEWLGGLRTLNEAREPLGLLPEAGPAGDEYHSEPAPEPMLGLPAPDAQAEAEEEEEDTEPEEDDEPEDDEPPVPPKGKPAGKASKALTTSPAGIRVAVKRDLVRGAGAALLVAGLVGKAIAGDSVGTDRDNSHGLPAGAPLRRQIERYHAKQAKALLGTLPEIGAPLPEAFESLADYNDPMASAMTPILSAYWDEAGRELRARIGLDSRVTVDGASVWSVTDPNVAQAIEEASLEFCAETNATTDRLLADALADLRAELKAGLVEAGESIPQLTARVQAIFKDPMRAERIARTEASRAVNAASLMSARTSGVVQAKAWLLSSNACPQCHELAEQGAIPLGDLFGTQPEGGNPTYRDIPFPPGHPWCRCTMTYTLTPEYLDTLGADADGEVPAFGKDA